MKRLLIILTAVLAISGFAPHATEASSLPTESTVVQTAKKYLGVPYRYGGTTTSGIDCSAYTQLVFKNLGVSIPRTTGTQYNTGTAVAKSNLQVGDLVFFNTSGRGVSHVGIYAGNNSFIHASTSRGVTITSLSDPYYWGSKYIGARRVVDFPAKIVQTAATNNQASPYVTRLEAAVALAEDIGLKPSAKTTSYFNDIPDNHPKRPILNALYEAGIFTGAAGDFNPNRSLNRSQMAKILVEAYGLTGTKNAGFKDVTPGSWQEPYINTLYANGVTTGYGNGYYGVKDPLKKIQLDKFISRM